MIIFGTRGVRSTVNQGQFTCPQCEATKNYNFNKVTKFFTLLYLPLIPIGKKGEYIECQSCKGTFIPEVLKFLHDSSTDVFLSEYEKAMRHSMILIMLADGNIDPNEMVTVRRIVNKFGYNDLTLSELEIYVSELQASEEDLSSYLKKVTPSLNEHGKEMVIKCALAIASADGNIAKIELGLIKNMAKSLELTKSHLKEIFHETMTPTESLSDD